MLVVYSDVYNDLEMIVILVMVVFVMVMIFNFVIG